MNAPWVVAMDWRDALFLHWRADAAALRRVIPSDIELDLYDGDAWVSVVAFRIAGARARIVPPFAALPPFAEINLRTYARDAERAGVWFFSLDAADKAAVWAGRRLGLNYVAARIACAHDAVTYTYASERTDRRAPPARFGASARIGAPLGAAAPGSLAHWLVERYCFFTRVGGRTRRGDVVHEPWPLAEAQPAIADNTLLSAADVVAQDTTPLAHVSPGVSTRAWPLRSASRSGPTLPGR